MSRVTTGLPVVDVAVIGGGGVISNAVSNTNNVVGLVSVLAFVPEEGGTLGAVVQGWKESVPVTVQKRISGPLLDRIDIHLEVPRIPHEQLSDRRPGETSTAIQERVARAREIQERRFAGTTLLTNADMGPKELRQHAALDESTETLLGAAVRQMGLSAHVLSSGRDQTRGNAPTPELPHLGLFAPAEPFGRGGAWASTSQERSPARGSSVAEVGRPRDVRYPSDMGCGVIVDHGRRRVGLRGQGTSR